MKQSIVFYRAINSQSAFVDYRYRISSNAPEWSISALSLTSIIIHIQSLGVDYRRQEMVRALFHKAERTFDARGFGQT